jgi:hypothetical protein
VKEQLFVGDELEAAPAIEHYAKLCYVITRETGLMSPYLLVPRRLQIMHLEGSQRYQEALELAREYKELLRRHFYIDDLPILIADIVIARLLRFMGDQDAGQRISSAAIERIRNLVDDPRNNPKSGQPRI